MAQEDAPQQLFDFVMQRFGRADILINNAGILRTGPLEEFDLSELRPMIAINYESIVRSCYLFARAIKAAGIGQLITVTSNGAIITATADGSAANGRVGKQCDSTSTARCYPM